MVRRTAPTKSTGGGGFSFADKVAAFFLVQMLRGGLPLGADAGPIAELHFETKESGWVFDDLLLVLKNREEISRCALSVKSDPKLTRKGFEKGFVQDAWEQWQGVAGSTFNPEKDFLGLATVPVAISVRRGLDALGAEVRSAPPVRLARRLTPNFQASSLKRRIFESLRNARATPDGKKPTAPETAKLLARIRLFHFDFESTQSGDEERAIALCSEIARSGTLDLGRDLWGRLIGLAAEARTTGGYFDIPKLVRSLRGAIELNDYPDHRGDWRAIEERANANLAEVRTVVGEDIHLERNEEENMIANALQGSTCVAVVGESGSGKSAVVATLVRPGHTFRRVLWVNAEQLSQPSQPDLSLRLGLRHSFIALIGGSNLENCILVLDGFEQLRGDARSRALELARIVTEAGAGQWKILVTVQPHEWVETRRALLGAGITKVERLDFANPEPAEVLAKIRSVPGVASLFNRRELRPILCNLATLHWVIQTERVRRFDSGRAWIGEEELIEWIWKQWVGESTDKHARDALLRHLGEREGERISGAVPIDNIVAPELGVLGELEKKGVLRVTESAVKFSHDLMGDWARLRSLVASGDEAAARIREKAEIPRWGRALRLYAQRLVERDEGLKGWKAFVSGLSGENPEEKLASDLFLDGIVFAANADSLLERVWGDLIADGAQILRRLLRRIVHVATVPDWRFREELPAEDADLAAAWFRIPNPLFWLPLLGAIGRQAEDVAREGVFEAATVCELWLRNMPLGFPGRREAGQVALALAREVQGRRAEGVIFVGDADRIMYEALLHAAPEYPDEVSQVALELCGRRDEAEVIKRRALQAAEAHRRKYQKQEEQEWAKRRKRTSFPGFMSSSWGPLRNAGPDGPTRRVPEGFRSAVLDTNALSGLASVRPQVAREVLLAVCLDEPKRQSNYGREPFSLPGFAYWPGGSPPMYWKGGFYRFLQLAPSEGLDAIIRLVNFATERWLENAVGHDPSDEERRAWGVEVLLAGKTVHWVGDGHVFAWHRDVPALPDVVVCALMALEKWLYELVENGERIDDWVETIFDKSSSLALAGVLVAVGLKNPQLFTGVLQPLLGNLALYQYQLHLALQESQEVWTIGMVLWTNHGQKVFRLVQEWHRLPHRKLMLQDAAVEFMLFAAWRASIGQHSAYRARPNEAAASLLRREAYKPHHRR